MKSNITAIVNTFNEERHIEKCIDSLLGLSAKIIVVDSGSTDQTIQVAKKCGVEVREVRRFQYVEQIREMSIDFVKDGWILILDADERITPELKSEILKIVQDQNYSQYTHFKLPRKNIFGENVDISKRTWLKHGGWWPDYQLRLFQKDAFISWPDHIHSNPKFKGPLGHLSHPIQHFIVSSLEGMVLKTLLFEDIESDLLYKANKKVHTLTFFRKFLGELYRRLIKHHGYLDGTVGIIESIYQAYSKTITYLFLYEKQHEHQAKKSGSL